MPMPTGPVRAAFCAFLAAVALPALPGQAPQGAKAQPIEKRTFKTLADLQAAYGAERDKAERALREKELAALRTYLKAKPADREKALIAAQDLAFRVEKWSDAVALGSEYVAEFASGRKLNAVKLVSARATARLGGKNEDARRLFSEVVDGTKDDPQSHFDALIALIDHEKDAGETDAARAALDRLAADFRSENGIEDFVKTQKQGLDLIGTEPKPFDVKDLDGKPLSIAALRGNVVLLDFWATWCGPCIGELPNVLRTYEKYRDKGFRIVGVSLDQDEQKLREFIAEQGMTWPQFFDGKGWQNELAQLYEVKSIPATWLLDTEGKIYRTGLRGDALDAAVEKLLAKPPATSAPKKP